MNLSQLYYFRKLAQLQHYTKAAKELYITQPSLSDAISSLEKELGIALFQKCGRNIQLTRQGKEFYYFVCNALNELDTGIAIAKEQSGSLGGTIIIGCIPTLLSDFLPHAIEGYCEHKNPMAKFDVHHGFTADIIEHVKNGDYDLGICSRVEHEPDLVFIPLIAHPLIAIVNQKHPLASMTEISVDDLEPYALASYRLEVPIGKSVNKFLTEHNLNAVYAYDDEISLGGAARLKPIVAIATETPFLKQFDNLVHIKIKDAPADLRMIYMIYNKKNFISKSAESFADYLVAKEMKLPPEAK